MYKNRLEFILSNENANLRRDNWRDFIRQIYNKKENKQHRNAVLTCSYKNFENIKRILLTSSEEFKTVNMDYIVVISSVLQEEVSAFLSFLLDNNFKNVIVLEAITNLGGSGGVALGLEYILNGAYVKVILLEDDVEILDDDFFSQMFIAIDETTLVHSTCKNSKNAYGAFEKSWCLQGTGYAASLLRKIGNLNPTYFQKSEDSDFLERIQRVVKKEQYDTKILETYHYHPNYKSSALRMWFIYFTIRNHLYTCAKSGIIHYVSYFPIIFAHIWSGVLQISGGFKGYIYAILKGIFDFLFKKRTFAYNNKIIQSVWSQKLHIPNHQIIEILDVVTIKDKVKDVYQFLGFYTRDTLLDLHLHNSIVHLFKVGVISINYYSPVYPINLLGPETYIIENVNYHTQRAQLVKIDNGNVMLRYLMVIISFFCSCLIFLICLPFIFIKYFFISKYKI